MADELPKKTRRVVTSFMLRFIYEAEATEADFDRMNLTPALEEASAGLAAGTAWRGVVQHIQSGTEYNFSKLAEAEAFIMKHIKV